MSSHPHPHGELVNENVHHEEHDINIRAIVTFAVVLTVICVGIEVSMVGFFKLLNLIETKSEPVVSPLTVPAATDGKEFPLPSLQLTPWADLKKRRAEEAAHMHSYGWVDQSAGIGRIPIDRAKALLLEKGLPVRPDVVDASAGTHVAATGESAGGRNLPGGQADKSSAPAAPAPTASAPTASAPPVSPAASQPAPKGPGGAL